jgi:hypothetical protein
VDEPGPDVAALPEAARAFLEGEVDLLPGAIGAEDAERLVQVLIARGDAARLERLGESRDKSVAKSARRGLHLLRTRGAAPPPARRREFRVHGPYAEEVPSLASMIDGRGERIVWLVRPAQEGGYEVYQAEISDERGLLAFTAGAVAKKEWRAHAERVIADRRLAVGEVTGAHARWLIEQAWERAIAAGRSAPEGFAAARLSLGVVARPDRHPALELAAPLSPDEARPRLGTLFELPEIAPWIPPRAALDPLDLELGQIATSRLVVDPTQREAQVDQAIARVIERTLTPEERDRYAERLRETALLLAARGAIEEARLAVAGAALIDDRSSPAADNPFFEQMFKKLVNADRLAHPEENP